ncbi:MAG: PD-(D/E)XK nuclease family protein, partial [Betaproteobacteria bacterium AqS2]|nr:PD-(D/E)XK nuclease family protein [Betaproteobacteria bacterium AqS2]
KFHGQLIGKTKGSDGQAPAEASSASLREIIRLATDQSPPVWSKEKPEGFKEIPEMSLEERRYFSWEFGHYVERYVGEIKDLYLGGGQIKAVEVDLGCKLPGSNVKLTAKADRIDGYEGKGDAIVDVKTGKPENYDDSREYPQLPLYIKLYETKDFKGEIEKQQVSVEHTNFWTMYLKSGVIEMKKVDVKDPNEVADHMQGLLDILEKASPSASVCLPANGVHKVCQYCNYGGLCRKKHWGREGAENKKDSSSAANST